MVGKRRVKIVTDSTADIPRALAESLDIAVVPLTVHFGSEVYRDGVDISAEQFYRRLRAASTLATTAAPAPGAFAATFREAAGEGREVLSINVSARLSATYHNALMAAGEFDSDRIAVVDSRTTSMALGWIVIRAAEEARAGASLTELRFLVNQLLPLSHVHLTMDTLENLRKGGRIGRASALLGTLLNVKPIITVTDGEPAPFERVRTLERAIQRLAAIAKARMPLQRLAVGYTDDPAPAARLRRLLEDELPAMDILTYQAGPIVGNYVGRGGVGVITLGVPS